MKNYKVGVFLSLAVLLCAFNFVSAKNKDLPLLDKVIYLDPGHGGNDPGAYYKNVKESDLNLQLSNRIMKALKDDGATVYLTRYDDYDLSVNHAYNRKRSDLSRRANIINKSGCDMFISIHLNASESFSWYGAQVYYDNINSENQKIAAIFQEELKRYLNTTRDYKENNTKQNSKKI